MKTKLYSNKIRMILVSVLFSAVLLFGCGGTKEDPLKKIVQSLSNVPTYSIVLEDMNTEGVFSKQFFHKYRVVQEKNRSITDWMEVSESFFKQNEANLGMALVSKKDGKMEEGVAPPGYAYVGDEKYGRWRQDGSGNSFWEFYGKYALFSSLFGGWSRPVYFNDFDSYKGYKKRKRPFYGRANQFGTRGSVAKKQNPNFFARKMSGVNAGKSSFSNKVKSRVGRTKSTFRSRSGGVGK